MCECVSVRHENVTYPGRVGHLQVCMWSCPGLVAGTDRSHTLSPPCLAPHIGDDPLLHRGQPWHHRTHARVRHTPRKLRLVQVVGGSRAPAFRLQPSQNHSAAPERHPECGESVCLHAHLSILHSVVDHHACLFRRLCRLFRFNRHQLSVWSPVLQSLDLQACYSLEKIRLLDKHALAAVLPDDFRPSRNIRVNLLNACVDRSLLAELSSNPRIGQVSGVDKLDGVW